MKVSFIVLILCLLFSCENEKVTSPIDWSLLQQAIIEKDDNLADQEISKLLSNANPNPCTDDPIGQKANIDSLVSKINQSIIISSQLYCYACIKTLPPQTEIVVVTDSSGQNIHRIIDILTPDDGKLEFVRLHDYYMEME